MAFNRNNEFCIICECKLDTLNGDGYTVITKEYEGFNKLLGDTTHGYAHSECMKSGKVGDGLFQLRLFHSE